MNGLELLLRNEAATLLLEAARISGMVIVAPLGFTQAPNRIKVALVILLTLAAHGDFGTVPVSEGPTEALIFSAGFEFLFGVAIGMVPRFLIGAVEIAGEHVAPMMGIGVAQMFDPSSHTSQNVLTSLLRNLAILLGLLVGLHRVVIGAVLGSFRAVPAGALHAPQNLTEIMLAVSAEAFVTGVKLAIPMIAVLLMTQVALAFVSRAAPAMQVFSVGFAVTTAVGALLLILVLPDMGYDIAAAMSHVAQRIEALVLAVTEP
jgi:flagellar biosynthetic protein FliR